MRISILAVATAAAVMLSGAANAQAQAPAAPTAPAKPAASAPAPSAPVAGPINGMTTTDTPIGDILDNPAAKAVVEKHLPEVIHGDQIEMARGMTLLSIQSYAPDTITDAKLAAIDADFKAAK
jgi:hypothetical protein